MTTPNQTPISTNSNGDLKTSNSNDENKMSNFCLIPLPEGRPKIPLRIGQTEVGRKMLTEQLQITSQTHPKKMSVSRHQVTLTVTSDKVVLVSIGLNAINLIMKGETLAPEKNKNYTLSIGDSFTLCGQHFPFQLVTMDDSIPVPRPPEIKEEKKSKVATGVLAIPVKGMPPASNNNNNNNNLRSSDERPSEYWTTPSTVPSIPPNMAGVIPDYGYQYWNYYPYYPYYYPQLSQHTQMNRTPQQTYEDWKKRQLLEKKVKAEPKKKKAKEELVLRRSASIGYIVETYRKDKGHKMMGTITNYSEARRMYEITFGDRVVVWEAEQNLAVKSLPKKKEQKKKRVSSSSEEESELSDESSSESDSDDSGVDKKKKKRRSSQRLSNRQKKSTATYFEWPSDSSSDDDGDNFSAPSKSNSGNVKKRKQKKTNWSAIEKALTVTGKKTAILYSDICLKHYVPNWHLERPSRVSQIMECVKTLKNHYPNHLEIVTDISPADRKLLTAVHDEQYIAKMENQSPDNDTPRPATQFSLDDRGPEDCDTFMSHFSFDAAKTAAGAVCKAIDLVVDGKYRNAFCCIRPPGHHCGFKGHTAEAASQGYCIINNVAIGGFYAVKTHNFKRIAVVDFDVHHGNGTEEILQNNDRFLFVSIHVGEIYPGTGHEQASRASNVLNISLEPGDGSEVFRKAFDSQIMTRLESYKPELILLSSGFDGHKRDPTDDGLRLEEADYSYITDKMMEFADRTCKGRIVSVLEGGYHLPSLRKSVKEHLISLMKKVPSEPTKSTVTTTQTSVTTASSILQSPAIQEFLKTSNIQSATLTLTSTTTTVSESVTQTVAASKPPVVDLIS